MRNLKRNRIYKITITVLLFLCAGSFCYSLEINGPGKQMYMKQCSSCHGDKGEGVKGEYEEAMLGDWSLSKLTRYVIKSMPDDDPDLCVGDDAAQVAKYIFNAFYSMNCILCIVFFALYLLPCILCIAFYALYSMCHIQCIVFYELYFMHCILCIVFYALYFMHCISCYRS